MKSKNKELEEFKRRTRELVAIYFESEGCSCCRGEDHDEHKDVLGAFLEMKRYDDNSGVDYSKYLPKKEKQTGYFPKSDKKIILPKPTKLKTQS